MHVWKSALCDYFANCMSIVSDNTLQAGCNNFTAAQFIHMWTVQQNIKLCR